MIYGSLCSGIEAASVAWEPLGWKAAFLSEIDKNASRVLAHHYPKVPNLGDMTKFKEWPDYAIDLLVGGTPCQSFSVAGLRQGLADPRGNLALVYLGVVERYKPNWVVWENVPGVLSSNRGRDFGSFLGALGKLGYGWAYRVLDAQFCRTHGFERAVPQRRRRVFIVAYLGDWRRAAAVLSFKESLSGNPPPRREAGKGFARDVASSLVSSGRGVARTGETRGQDPVIGVMCAEIAPTLNAHFGEKQGLEDQHIRGGQDSSLPPVAMCLNAGAMGRQDAESETLIPTTGGGFDVAHTLRAEGFDASEDGSGRGTPLIAEVGMTLTSGGNGSRGRLDPVNTDLIAFPGRMSGTQFASTENLSPSIGAANPMAVAFQSSQSGVRLDDVHATLDSNNGSRRHNGVVQDWAVRRLTPVECSRLQGFPDDYLDLPNKPLADGSKYKMLGNSFAVNVIRWIGRRIEIVEQIA